MHVSDKVIQHDRKANEQNASCRCHYVGNRRDGGRCRLNTKMRDEEEEGYVKTVHTHMNRRGRKRKKKKKSGE